MERSETSSSPVRSALAWAVHLYTALGAVFGFLALTAAFSRDYAATFRYLAIALVIDATDGTLARRANVKQVLPWIDGELLDNIVDYLTYVVVPVGVLVQPGILPPGTQATALSILLASAYGFSRTDSKGFVEHYFQGFPSYWNVLAFYYVILGTEPWLNLTLMLVFVVLVFAPMRWLYPSRMEKMRVPTIALGAVWGVMGFVLVAQMPEVSKPLAWLSLFYPLYYTAGSAVYHLTND